MSALKPLLTKACPVCGIVACRATHTEDQMLDKFNQLAAERDQLAEQLARANDWAEEAEHGETIANQAASELSAQVEVMQEALGRMVATFADTFPENTWKATIAAKAALSTPPSAALAQIEARAAAKALEDAATAYGEWADLDEESAVQAWLRNRASELEATPAPPAAAGTPTAQDPSPGTRR